MPQHVFYGTFIHAPVLDELEYRYHTAIAVDADGSIVTIERVDDGQKDDPDKETDASKKDTAKAVAWIRATLLPRLGWPADVAITAGQPGQFFFPGFIDTHIHASQYPNVGIFGKSTLLDWLNKYTFPLEASLADLSNARRVYSRAIRKTLSHGTTTASYYATIDVGATNLLADLCLAAGQRALVGRVCMDTDMSPEFYRDESPEFAEQATRACMAHIAKIDPSHTIVRPVITPRFAPSCTPDLLGRLGALAKETGLPVQTHISENKNEIELVGKLFADVVPGGTYTDVYDHFGLLTKNTILAHGIHLTEGEADIIHARHSKISHCPCSNSAITSGAARIRWLLNRGIEVGLGTDVSGGYSPSILEAARSATLVSRHVAMGGDETAKLSVEEVLYLATTGGAQVVGLSDKIGLFQKGMKWDAQLIGLGIVDSEGRTHIDEATGIETIEDTDVDVFGWESWEDRVAKWLFNGDDRNTKKVWVNGRLVHDRAAKGGIPV